MTDPAALDEAARIYAGITPSQWQRAGWLGKDFAIKGYKRAMALEARLAAMSPEERQAWEDDMTRRIQDLG